MGNLKENLKFCKSDPKWHDSLPLVQVNCTIANEVAFDSVVHLCKFARTGSKSTKYARRYWFNDEMDIARPQTIDRLMTHSIQAAHYNVRKSFNSRLDAFLDGQINREGVGMAEVNGMRTSIAAQCLAKIDSSLVKELDYQYSQINEPHRRSRAYVKLLFCELSRHYSMIATTSNQYWTESGNTGAYLETKTTAKRRQVALRKTLSGDTLIAKAKEHILQDEDVCMLLFSANSIEASKEACNGVLTWMQTRWELQTELERLNFAIQLDNHLEQVIDSM